MPLSWNEIRARAVTFSREWSDANRERSEAQSFWNEFFDVFGVKRRLVASFEEPVRNLRGAYGFIDLIWPGTLLAEHKGRGLSLDKAQTQAMQYVQDLAREQRHTELPRYLLLSDFARIALHDLETGESCEFGLAEFHENIHRFAFIPGYKQHSLEAEDPINLKAVQILGDLHDALEAIGCTGHELERMLVRVLFCLFAEDTGIFDRNAFSLFLQNHTQPDGANIGPMMAQFFQVLNTPKEKRHATLLEELSELPYVNGDLFGEALPIAAFDADMRNRLIACTRFDWSRISPAVFGALFQGVMEPRERRQIGAHYTSERDILKVIGPLFLDELKAELEKAGREKPKLKKLHDRLANLRLLDPACGCGNFLVVSYRELRLLEIEILRRLNPTKGGARQQTLDIGLLLRLDVGQMYGIEIEEWPARIAEVAMWLMDHQMNQRVSVEFGAYFVRLPLTSSPHIVHGNALRIDWNEVLPAKECTHVLGNPPFVGTRFQTDEQRQDMALVTGELPSAGLLDYVTAWYLKAAQYIHGTKIIVGFVSTNSITQGEQVGVLWPEMFRRGISIHFAHRTFAWQSEARGRAHVHCVIVGFAASEPRSPTLFDYQTLEGEPIATTVSRISPYLVEGPNTAIANRSTPLCRVPEIGIGNKPIDDGNYLFTQEEYEEFVKAEPASRDYFYRWYGAQEFLNGDVRWCLWLGDCNPDRIRTMPLSLERIDKVRRYRLASRSAPTQRLAGQPTRFHVENMPAGNFLLIPEVSSERRRFIPMGFMGPEVLCSNLVKLMPDATLYHFGVMSSTMHMAWVRQVAGRLKSDFRYSAKLVFNNYPWPEEPTAAKRTAVEQAAQRVLDARAEFPDSTLADLYDPLTMPKALVQAHTQLDRAVDKCYRTAAFTSERQRVEFLFERYQQLTAPLLEAPRRRR